MTKRKGFRNNRSPLESPAAASDKTENPSMLSPTARSIPPITSERPISHPQPPPTSTMMGPQTAAVWTLIRTLPEDLRVFLEEDYKAKSRKILKTQFYRILLHFDPATKSRPSHNKADLNAAFKNHIRPRILPFLIPRPPPPMDTDHDPKSQTDFNPLARKTTCKMLIEVIQRRAPHIPIPSAARRDGLLLLYKAHVDKDLVIPGLTDTIRKPRALDIHAVDYEDIEDL